MVFGSNSKNLGSTTCADEEQHQEDEEFVDLVNDEDDQVQQSADKAQFPNPSQSKSQQGTPNDKPLYDEITLKQPGSSKNAGGSKIWVCKHCKGTFTSSYTRVHTHFFGPPLGKRADIKRCNLVTKDPTKYRELLERVTKAESVGVSKSLKSSVFTKKSTVSSKNPIEESFAIMERSAVNLKIVRALCANGIPFNVLRNPQFREMINAVKKAPADYKAPSSEKARTTLLDECELDVEKDLIGFKGTFLTQGVSIVSDGWTNVKHNPLINVLAVNSRGAMFMYADNFSGVEKTGQQIADYLIRAIEKVGSSYVLSVVTDNAANCKAAGQEVEKVYKHIFWSPCCVHTLNLIFKDFAQEFFWLEDVYKQGKMIVKYFLNHGQALAMFRENSKLEILKIAQTRFASHYILLKRLHTLREALSTTISLNSWRDRVKHGDEQTRQVGQMVVNTIRNDDFWNEVEDIIKITKPIYLMIRFCDGEGPKMGEIYEKMDNMVGELKVVMKDTQFASYFPEVEKIVIKRWTKMSIPLHCLGFALSPRFYDTTYLKTLAPGDMKRKAPNIDKEVMKGVLEAFRRISESKTEEKKLREQFAMFHMKKGLYGLPGAILDAVSMEGIDWWSTYGAETPELAEVAIKVLSQPISSSSAERNWSTYSYIHSIKRNRLAPKRADKCVYVHSNIRLCSRFSEAYKQGPHKGWDMNPESTNFDNSRLEDQMWDDLEDDEQDDNGRGKRQRVELD